MGGMWFDPEVLGDSLSETAGYKSGLALSIEECSGQVKIDTPLSGDPQFQRFEIVGALIAQVRV
jgi:hypothetical protein